MTGDDYGLIAAVIAGAFLLAALLAWRGGDSRRDLGLLGGAGVTLAAASAALLAG